MVIKHAWTIEDAKPFGEPGLCMSAADNDADQYSNEDDKDHSTHHDRPHPIRRNFRRLIWFRCCNKTTKQLIINKFTTH